MAWTTSDLTSVETAIRELRDSGVTSVSINGQSAQTIPMKDLLAMRAEIKGELAIANANSLGGLRMRLTKPPAAG